MTYKVLLSHLFTRTITVLSVIERAKLWMATRFNVPACWLLSTALLGCGAGPETRRAVPNYDDFTGRLVQLSADQNGNGRIDQWTYLDGNRPLRGEADTDDDGRVDRWEYFDERAALTLIGSSSLGDGVEDTWTRPGATANGEMQVTRSRMRDRRPDRHEYFRGDVLARAEEDTNGDGRIDKWERYEGASLREAAFDTTFTRGRADRRVRYDAQGQSVVETDPDGDGQFVRVQGERVSPPRTPGAFE
jgi:YD repeat-containing protein